MAPPMRSAVAPRHRRGSHPPDRTRLPRGPDPLDHGARCSGGTLCSQDSPRMDGKRTRLEAEEGPPIMPLHARREQGKSHPTPREGGQVLEARIDGDIRAGKGHVSQRPDGASEMEGGSHV